MDNGRRNLRSHPVPESTEGEVTDGERRHDQEQNGNMLGLSADQVFQLKKLELEMQIENRRQEAEAENRRQEIEAEDRRLGAEEAQKIRDHQFQMFQLEVQMNAERIDSRNGSSRDAAHDNFDNERLTRQVKESLPKLTITKENVTHVFSMVETAFRHFRVTDEIKPQILISIIGNQIPNLFAICDDEDLKCYESIKRAILVELQLSPTEYHQKFLNLRKSEEINFSQFGNQLAGIFSLYLECRRVTTFEELKSLIIADQFKAGLKPSTLKHVLTLEAGEWFDTQKMSRICENYEQSIQACHIPKESRKSLNERTNGSYASRNFGSRPQDRFTKNEKERSRPMSPRKTNYDESSNYRGYNSKSSIKRCFQCGSEQHFRQNCPQLKKGAVGNPKRAINGIFRRETDTNEEGLCANINLGRNTNPWSENDEPQADVSNPLEYRDIFFGGRKLRTLIDSGSEALVIKRELVDVGKYEVLGNLTLRHAFEGSVEATAIQIPASLHEGDGNPILLTAAITDKLCAPALIPTSLFDLLKTKDYSNELVASVGCDLKLIEENEMTAGEASDEGETVDEASFRHDDDTKDAINTDERDPAEDRKMEAIEFLAEQTNCPSLISAWEKAKYNREDFYVENDVLMHHDIVTGEKISQVVLPSNRKNVVLKKAHDESCGAHLGEKRTNEKIRRSFFWPSMKKDVREYCQSCHECQTRRVVISKDRVPIQAIERPERPFEVWITDIVGPIEPASSKGHKYILTAVDLCTRWPEAIAIRNITAKTTCEALLEIFSHTGLPRMLCSDGGGGILLAG